MNASFRTDVTEVGPTAVLALHGELDMSYAPAVNDTVERMLAAKPPALAIDLRGLEFMDSSGIHALISTEQRCRGQGIRFLLVRGNETIGRLLSLCGLDTRFEMVSDPEQLASDSGSLATADHS